MAGCERDVAFGVACGELRLVQPIDRAEHALLDVRVEPIESYATDDALYWQNRPTVAWVQATTLAISTIHDGDHMLIWTTDLISGEPVGNVAVELLGDGRVARTDPEGLAEVPLATVWRGPASRCLAGRIEDGQDGQPHRIIRDCQQQHRKRREPRTQAPPPSASLERTRPTGHPGAT